MTKCLIEAPQPCLFRDCPPGLFAYRDILCFKSEYSSAPEQPDAYCIETGEYFWGGTRDRRERLALEVTPLLSAASPIDALVARIRELEAALFKIEDWQLPKSEQTWPDGTPMSYGAAFGSNGERNWARTVAHEALIGGTAASAELRQAHRFVAGTVLPPQFREAARG
jgi:hypothetical protein